MKRQPSSTRVFMRSLAPSCAPKAELPPGFVNGHRDGVREIQAAVTRAHWDLQALFFWKVLENAFRETRSLAPEYECITFPESGPVDIVFPLCCKGENPPL